ncbi:MAG: S-layer homology domain-containing protein [Bacillus sp. (in: firmicutes)]
MKGNKKKTKEVNGMRKTGLKVLSVAAAATIVTSAFAFAPVHSLPGSISNDSVAYAATNTEQLKMSLEKPTLTVNVGDMATDLKQAMGLKAVGVNKGYEVDFSSAANIDFGGLDFDKAGTYNVKFSVDYIPDNNEDTRFVGSISGKVVVVQSSKPVLTVKPAVLEQGQKFVITDWASATDKEDGNLTKDIIVEEMKNYTQTIKTDKVGTFDIIYSVQDSAGQTAYMESTLTVKPKGSAVEKPKEDKEDAVTSGFKDVPASHWAYKEIVALVNQKVIKGYTDGTFKPTDNIRRDHVALLLSAALDEEGLKAVEKEKQFKDVPKSSPYYEAIRKVQRAGIFDGDAGYFKPNASITRAEMAKVMVEAFDIPMTSVDAGFTDVPKSSFTYKYIQALSASGITEGSGNGKFNPNSPITRAEYAVFLYNALEK